MFACSTRPLANLFRHEYFSTLMAAFVCGQRFHAHPSSLFVHVVPSINDRVQGRAINRHCTLRVTWVVCLIALTLVRVQGQQTKADPRLLADKTEAGSSETVVYCNVSSTFVQLSVCLSS